MVQQNMLAAGLRIAVHQKQHMVLMRIALACIQKKST
jgi:hypothetical protein